MFEAINWPEAMTPSRSPIHFTNELEVEASPETIWSLLVDPRTCPTFYPGVGDVQLLDGHDSLRLGTRFETNLAGQDAPGRHKMTGSRGRVGAAGDNAAMESFFSLLQKNVLDRRTWATGKN